MIGILVVDILVRVCSNCLEDISSSYDVIIVDEVSMIDIFVASALLKAVRLGTKLIFVGDKDQLMSVGAGSVLADIIESGTITTVELTQIFRQQETSKIVVNAHLAIKLIAHFLSITSIC